MPLLKLDKACLHYGSQVLLDTVDLQLRRGDCIGLLGRNGEGKTTLLEVIAGQREPDSGERWLRPGTRLALLDQTLPDADEQSVFDLVADGLSDVGALLKQYHHLTLEKTPNLAALEKVQHQLEIREGWRLGQRVETILSQLQLPADTAMKELSGGWRRRVLLGRALVGQPDILLLDEPTNHLDIPAIEWLEEFLQDYRGALLFVTHDRRFLQGVANQIVELDRGRLSRWVGDYRDFLRFREQQQAVEDKERAQFDRKLAQEEIWIRQGIKARRTRNEGRVRALEAMREQRRARQDKQGRSRFGLESAERSGKIVIELEQVDFQYDGRPIIDNFSTTVLRGDRIGIVGANGVGKSTLIKILLGELQPQRGRVRLGSNIECAYFDQLRQLLDPEKNLIDNICEGREYLEINGKKRHAIGYLGDFLFSPEHIRTPLKALSGGEQNRAILAKLFSKSVNLLVLDEPTNDLDIETLELLEEILLDFDGTLLLVSHDRQFMDNVVTGILVLDGSGKIEEQVGGYSDWVARGGKLSGLDSAIDGEPKPKPATRPRGPSSVTIHEKTKKLSYKDQRELDALPDRIEQLEEQLDCLETEISDPAFYQGDRDQVQATLLKLSQIQQQLQTAYDRWQELENEGR